MYYDRCLQQLRNWWPAAERWWHVIPGQPNLGCYGTGYNMWGVQTNQKYLAAMAALGTLPADHVSDDLRSAARERALAALRFSLWSHCSGEGACTDGTQWGHTWISSLGIERMMFGVQLLAPFLDDDDQDNLRRMLCSEAEWICDSHIRGSVSGVSADVWASSGRNNPESNLWNGALLWRVSALYPEHGDTEAWRLQANRFLMNSISVADDATDERLLAGRAISDWHVGANFFPNYALDHHGYMNVGYMVICISNAAMLHYDLAALDEPAPQALYHHNDDLWQVIRRMIFNDGRLARIGGDSRLRYTYCQDYLLPSLVYAADHLQDPAATHWLDGQLTMIEQESAGNADGSFYGSRLNSLRDESPYYYTRLESDRAVGLAMVAAYHQHADLSVKPDAPSACEALVAGGWCEPEYGAVLHRSPTRFASFAWRAHGYAQGICQPPDDGHLADWSYNLGGRIRFLGDNGIIEGGQSPHRLLVEQQILPFDGGFLTWGTLIEGVNTLVAEGWRGTDQARHELVICALPDGHTMLGIQLCRAADKRVYTQDIKGLHLNLPNDLYNGFERSLVTASGTVTLRAPAESDGVLVLDARWLSIEERVGTVGIYGTDSLMISRSTERRGGKFASLHVEEICWPCQTETRAWNPGEVILDIGWGVLSSVDAKTTAAAADSARQLDLGDAFSLRGIVIRGQDAKRYALVTNLSDEEARIPAESLPGDAPWKVVENGRRKIDPLRLPPRSARLLRQ